VLRRLADVTGVPMDLLHKNDPDTNSLPLTAVVVPSAKITLKLATKKARALHKQTGEIVQTLEELRHA
jgi:hypothetical protein